MTLSLIFTAASILLTGGCKENAVDPPATDTTIWKEVEQFRGVDIRYMTVHNGTLYVSAARPQPNGWQYTFALMKTVDGDHWDTLKVFESWIGPIAFHGDTLTILEDGRTWKYHPSFGWEMFWKHLMTANFAKDMVWLNNHLYVFENAYTMTFFSKDSVDMWSHFPNSPIVSKFYPAVLNGKEVAYTRQFVAFEDELCVFDGYSFAPIMSGIPKEENVHPNYPSLFLLGDTLYAGFNSPSTIKRFTNGAWKAYTDSIPNTIHANLFRPPLINRPTAITFAGSQMYVGTEWSGVLKWTGSSWEDFSSGLPLEFPSYPQYKLLTHVVQLFTFHQYLFAGYGEPWSAPVYGGRGLYRATTK